MQILLLLMLTMLSGKTSPVSQITISPSQPQRPVVLPEAKTIRALPPSSIEPAPAVLTSLPDIDVRSGNTWEDVWPRGNSTRLSLPNSQFTSLVVVQSDGTSRSLNADELKQWIEKNRLARFSSRQGIIVENGAVFINTGGFTIPMTGGGASGCFSVTPERNEQIQKEVRLQFEKGKAVKEKK